MYTTLSASTGLTNGINANMIGNVTEQQQQQQQQQQHQQQHQTLTSDRKRKLNDGLTLSQSLSKHQQQPPSQTLPILSETQSLSSLLTDTTNMMGPASKQMRTSNDPIYINGLDDGSMMMDQTSNNKGSTLLDEFIARDKGNSPIYEQFNNISDFCMKTEPPEECYFHNYVVEEQDQYHHQQAVVAAYINEAGNISNGNNNNTNNAMTFNDDPVPCQTTTQLAMPPPENKNYMQQIEDPVKLETSEVLLNFNNRDNTISNKNSNINTNTMGNHSNHSISNEKQEQFIARYLQPEQQQFHYQLQQHKKPVQNTLNSFPNLDEDSNGPSDYFNEKIDEDGDT